jgi:hypothetical protein
MPNQNRNPTRFRDCLGNGSFADIFDRLDETRQRAIERLSWSESEGDYLPLLAALLIGDAWGMECISERAVKMVGMSLNELGEGLEF